VPTESTAPTPATGTTTHAGSPGRLLDASWKIRFFIVIFAALLVVRSRAVLGQDAAFRPENTRSDYSFLVAGHAYGSHNANNVGLHPDFIARLGSTDLTAVEFLVFTGDTTRDGSQANWETVERELGELNRPYFFAMGNHDDTEEGRKLFIEKYGNTFYSFDRGSERFVILDTQRVYGTVSRDQLVFLRECLSEADGNIRNVLVFMHLVLWNRHAKYKEVRVNEASRYSRMRKSNFWEDVYPILQEHDRKKVFVFSGDLGARPDSIPAFYDTWDHITLIASGMGEVNEENYLLIRVLHSSLDFRLIALNPKKELKRLEDYTVDRLADYHDPKPVPLAMLLGSYWSRLPRLLNDHRFRLGVLLTTLLFSTLWLLRIMYAKWGQRAS